MRQRKRCVEDRGRCGEFREGMVGARCSGTLSPLCATHIFRWRRRMPMSPPPAGDRDEIENTHILYSVGAGLGKGKAVQSRGGGNRRSRFSTTISCVSFALRQQSRCLKDIKKRFKFCRTPSSFANPKQTQDRWQRHRKAMPACLIVVHI